MEKRNSETAMAAESGARAGRSAINIHIGRQIRALRVTSGLSQEALGRVLGLTFQQIQKYEKGTNKVSAERLVQIAQYFDTPVGYFTEGVIRTGAEGRQDGVVKTSYEHHRLRLEIGRMLPGVKSARTLRAILGLVRSVQQPETEEAGEQENFEHAA
jgi:transcriptional regulator with XRE-family HTH domain